MCGRGRQNTPSAPPDDSTGGTDDDAFCYEGRVHLGRDARRAFPVVGRRQSAGRAPPTASFAGSPVPGRGSFNLAQGLIDRDHLLVLHNVREVPDPAAYNYTFLLDGGVGLVTLGWCSAKRGASASDSRHSPTARPGIDDSSREQSTSARPDSVCAGPASDNGA